MIIILFGCGSVRIKKKGLLCVTSFFQKAFTTTRLEAFRALLKVNNTGHSSYSDVNL